MKALRDNGLTIVLIIATLATLLGMVFTGQSTYNDELVGQGKVAVSLFEYLGTGHFLSALFENWESEFLQMSAYVVLTAFLFQRGSAESKDPDQPEKDDTLPRNVDAPLPVRIGGLTKQVYSYSLGLTLFALFVLSFIMHLRGSAAARAHEALIHGQHVPDLFEHLGSADFWFESFQNWQSEFLSTAVIIVLSIFLRFRGSPESKRVGAPHSQTGTEG
ncbi:DUF6766 family protein [Ensifer sp.]|uniref:DUF6766 family protein n=1 Tax=Ensifer sp. TaxID=1872086 RepID=UPI00289A9A1E|nr:DUF6766 family protein [Ensifer sp.]